MCEYTYVMTLIVDKIWKKLLEHFCGLQMEFFNSHFELPKM
jgi:hypothetical protein